MSDLEQRYMLLLEFTRRIDVHPNTARRLFRDRLPSFYIGSRLVVDRAAAETFIANYDPTQGPKEWPGLRVSP